MKRYQIALDDQILKKNRAFLRAMYSNKELDNADRWFDKRDNSIPRETDLEMNLERYLRLMNASFYIRLQIGSPDPDKIRCGARGDDKEGTDRFLWIIAPYTEKNYDIVSQIFKRTYKTELGSLGVLLQED